MEEASTKPATAAAVVVAEDPLLKIFKSNRHQSHSAEDLVRKTDPKSSKEPDKLAAAAAELEKKLRKLVETKELREVGPGLYKARMYFDQEHMIEHAFLGGMESVLYAFDGPLFRLNIGVLSVFIVRDPKKKDWTLTVRDSTIGKDYCLVCRIGDGTYTIGSGDPSTGGKNYLQVPGRYIAPKHVTLTIAGENIHVEDNKTLNGTRVDHLTEDGLARFQELSNRFLKETPAREQGNRAKRGRFVLNQFTQNHQSFEATFFNAVVDSLLLAV